MSKKKAVKDKVKKYRITLDAKQAAIVNEALELYSRIGIGQLEEVVNHMRYKVDPRTEGQWDKLDLAAKVMNLAKEVLYKMPSNASYGIYSKDVPDCYRIAWDVMRVIRHQFFKDRPKSEDEFMGGVDSYPVDDPSVPDQPLATIERVEE